MSSTLLRLKRGGATALLVAMLLALQTVDAFTSSTKLRSTRNEHVSKSSLSLLPKDFGNLLDFGSKKQTQTTLPMFLGSTAPFGISSLASGGAVATFLQTPEDPLIEAQLLTDMSHLGLDLAVFLGPGMIALRLLAVVGRLCTMAADYLPDHAMLPEEFVFQSFMLTVAFVGLAKAALLPTFAAFSQKVTVKDVKTFRSLFAPAGTTWAQFKALSVCAFKWIEVQDGDIITTDEDPDNEDEYIYWLSSGSISVESAGATLYNVNRTASKEDAGRGLVGERRLLRRLGNDRSGSGPRTTVRATSNATLLRIHTPNLKMLMDNDQDFADTIRTLLFQGMEAKLNAKLLEASATTTSPLKPCNVTA